MFTEKKWIYMLRQEEETKKEENRVQIKIYFFFL